MDSLNAALQLHREALARGGGAVLRSGSRSCVTRVGAGDRAIVVKETRAGSPLRSIADLFRGSAAARAWRAGRGLVAGGIPCSTPLAFLERRRFGLVSRSWIVLEHVGERDANEPYASGGPSPSALANSLCTLVIRLHRAGIDHGDLKANNIRMFRDRDRWRAAVVDLQSVRFRRRLPEHRRLLGLAQLNASLAEDVLPASDRIGALDRYLDRCPFQLDRASVRSRIVRMSLDRRHAWQGHDCASAPHAGTVVPCEGEPMPGRGQRAATR